MRNLRDLLRLLSAALALAAVLRFFHAPLREVVWRPATRSLGVAETFGFEGARGFSAHIRSSPSGLPVRIDGVPRGTSPLMVNVACREGDEVLLEVGPPGQPPLWTRSIACREDRLLQVHARIEKGPASGS